MPQTPIESALLAYLLAELPATTFYPGHPPQSVNLQTTDANTWNLISNVHDYNLGGAAGVSRARFQLGFFSTSVANTAQNAEAVRQVLQGLVNTNWSGVPINYVKLEGETVLYEQPENATDRGLFHRAVDFIVGYQESVPAH